MPSRVLRAVVFDFDGTLVQSNAIKAEGFETVCGYFGQAGLDALRTAQLELTSPDRYALLESVAELLEPADAKPLAERLIADYTRYCREAIAACNEVAGARRTLERLASYVPLFVNSATPTTPLHLAVQDRGLMPFFTGVYGRPANKIKNLGKIAQRLHCDPTALLVVGDGRDDYDCASASGAGFIGIEDSFRKTRSTSLEDAGLAENCDLLPDLVDLLALIETRYHLNLVSTSDQGKTHDSRSSCFGRGARQRRQ